MLPAARGAPPPSLDEFPPALMNYYSGYEAVSFELLENERRVPAIPSGIIPNTLGASDGPVASSNVALLCFESDIFAAFGGLFDHSVLVRSLSGVSGDMRVQAHRGRVVKVYSTPDSQHMLTGSEDTTFVLWSCTLAKGNYHKLNVSPIFTIYGHEDNPSAAAVCNVCDVVATASVDGVLLLHSISGGSLEETVRHPLNYSVDRILIQSSCYVPNILYTSNRDHVVHQISINGAPLRSFNAPGRITAWCATAHQFLLVAYQPFHNETVVVEASQQTMSNTPCVVYYHALSLTSEKTVFLTNTCPVQVLSCHFSNPQVVIGGTAEGSLVLVRSCRQQPGV
ncbi:hypothetical protein, conserved [Angomonas deanei]|uniref:Uncharacterized protein n=1 Tax=Angomonas deanei TaxID=59799 RepID=A0A7G2C576_9TRYP|nr:hypothetical protein, conserved [Angomonas deanei]